MALVSAISLSVVDDAGSRSSVRIFAPATATVAELQALSDFVVAALEDVTGGFVESATVTMNLTLPVGTRTTATADHFNQQGANFGFGAADTTYRHTVRVPAFLDSLIASGNVNTSDALVQAFYNAIITGDGTTPVTDEYGNDINAWLGAALKFRK